MPRPSTRPGTPARTGPRRPRTAALRAVLATGAVLAVTVGCSAQAVTDPAGAADDKPGSGSGVTIEPAGPASSSPSAKPAAASKPPVTPSAEPSKSASEKPAPPKPEPAKPKIVLASGAEGDQVRELQARLRQIAHFNRAPTGYYGSVTASAVTSFQAKRGLPLTGTTDTVTWERLLGMTRKPTAAELRPPAVEKPAPKPDPRCMTGRVMCISKTSRSLSWMIDGKVMSTMDVRFGSQYTPTREGTFKVGWKSRHHVSTIYDTPMPYAMFFSGGQAVHYSADFAARGYSGASHGCVNVRDEKKLASLFDQVRTGDKVVVYW
ncbi:L,D-transpeptidase family protein [Streptomyces sp. NBC_01716]|uniref:L,D-transpeptidase family protein n=1 Tax=Streptomyces sp. NBC_01716 TaxID=2975917 RepID=UPI002E362DAB|nr:L,D-transpeptidase family protein [Streptomyces sp. NBC_01716]